MIRLTMNPVDWALLIFLSIIWGGSFFFIEVAVKSVPPLTLVALRVSIAALALWSVIIIGRLNTKLPGRVWQAFLVMGLLNNAIPFALLTFAQVEIASALAAILNATTPLFGVMVAKLFLADEKPGLLKLLGVVIGFFGVVVMIGADFLGVEAVATTLIVILAQFMCLGAALSYAFAGAYGRRFKRYEVHPLMTAAGQLTGSTLLLWPLALIIDGPGGTLGALSAVPLASILALAIVSTALAYVIYFKLLATVGSTNLLLVTFLVPITASILGIVILGEQLTLSDILGMILIAIGLSAIDGRLWQRAKRHI